jgi:hypothetical protein
MGGAPSGTTAAQRGMIELIETSSDSAAMERLMILPAITRPYRRQNRVRKKSSQ